MYAWRRVRVVRADLRNMNLRSLLIPSATLNLNHYSKEQSIHDFRFRKADVGCVCAVMGWCCIGFRRLSSSCTWYDLEPVF